MKIPPLLFIFVLCGTLLTACSEPVAIKPESQTPAKVRTQVVEEKVYPRTERVMGTVAPKVRATLEAKVTGRIQMLAVIEGQYVNKGDLIAQLDAGEIRARLEQAKAVREQAERDLKRSAALLKQQSTTQSEFDAIESRHRSAQAGMAEAESMLAYASVLAPFNGIVAKKFAEVGDLATPGKALVQIENPSAMRLEAEVPEHLSSAVRAGAKLWVRVPAAGLQTEATIAEIAAVVKSDTRTLLVKINLPPTDKLKSGMFGSVDVPSGEERLLRIPALAVIRRGQIESVFVVTNDVAQLRLVKTGKQHGETVDIFSGIDSGESVVIEGEAALIDGQPVVLK